jgi:hypothetical protein
LRNGEMRTVEDGRMLLKIWRTMMGGMGAVEEALNESGKGNGWKAGV